MTDKRWQPPSTAFGKSSSKEATQSPNYNAGVLLARALIARQRAALDQAAPQPKYSDKLLADIELQLAWGILTEVVSRGPPSRSTARDSLVLHLMHFLVAERGSNAIEARRKAMELESLYDQAEPLFQMIAGRGRLAYLGDSRQHLVEVLNALKDSGRVA